ncbi:MAG: CDP-alcohol phosphatidyltransferase family protein [Acidimicrobiales bacterium]|nr:CDP-alcohol phosphatidyltransferase family protein [Acidimicrobiales bacterium]
MSPASESPSTHDQWPEHLAADTELAAELGAAAAAAVDEEADLYPAPGQDRVLTIPNLITVGRLAFLPFYLIMLLGQDNRVGAAILLGFLGATDFLDGYIARHFNQVSSIGRLLDPTADRILFFVGIGGILAVGGAPISFAAVVLTREIVVAAITVTLTVLGAEPVNVTWFGKAGTFALMVAFPCFLGGSSDAPAAPFLQALGWVWGLPGVLLSYYAAYRYIPMWSQSLRERHSRRASA